MKILFTGGGTGGHTVPLVAIVREIRKIHPREDLQLFYFGPRDNFGTVLLSQEGVKVRTVLSGKIRRYISWQSVIANIFDVAVKIPLGVLQAFFYILFLAPDFIFSKGGYGSIPTVIAGRIFQVPIFLHESDVSPGRANIFLSRFCVEIFISFPKTEYFPLNKTFLTGNPIRKELLQGAREEAKRIFKIVGGKPLVFISGGSQGAQRINDIILEVLPELLAYFEIIHQCGDKNYKSLEGEANITITEEQKKYYHLTPFLYEEELSHVFAAADFIVSRAGSGSVFEIAALGKPSILIPLPESAQNHQVKNAYAFAERGACAVLEEENLTPHILLDKLRYLLVRPEELEKMRQTAREFAKPEAGKAIAEYMLNYLKQ